MKRSLEVAGGMIWYEPMIKHKTRKTDEMQIYEFAEHGPGS